MGNRFLLAKYSDCYALLSSAEIKGGEGFMADTKDIYEVPKIDGFIGFLKVVACTKKKGDLPLIDEAQIKIPIAMQDQDCWIANPQTDESGSLIVQGGFINLIGIHIP